MTTSFETTYSSLNYFNYFTELEEAFIRRRGKHLWLSPVDWALMESWKDQGVPLHVAIRGVERAFDSYEAKPRHRSVKSLLYCKEEVEAQYAEWLEGKVGSGLSDAPIDGDGRASGDHELPFQPSVIIDHLRRAQASLQEASTSLTGPHDGDLLDAFARSVARLRELEDDLANSVNPDAQKLEESLTHLERMLDDAIRSHASEERLDAVSAYATEQLATYRKRMDKATYEQTFENVFIKRLREYYGLHRLSLFYL